MSSYGRHNILLRHRKALKIRTPYLLRRRTVRGAAIGVIVRPAGGDAALQIRVDYKVFHLIG
jgi:hypothetical protein